MSSTAVIFKASAMARDLANRLQLRVAGMTIKQDVDANRWPTLQCTVGGKSEWIRIRTAQDESDAEGMVDALGLPQRVYSPHLTEVMEEAAATPPTAGTNDMRRQVLAEVGKNGTEIHVLEGTGVETAASFAAAAALATTLVSTIRSDTTNPLTSQV
jgi:hypothetical protein